jgi:hypothetical protein
MTVLTQSQVSAGIGDINSRVKLDDDRLGYIIGYLRNDETGEVNCCVVDVACGDSLRDVVYLACEITQAD